MPKPQKLIHKGNVIFHMDFSNLNDIQEIRNLIDESAEFIRNQPQGSVLTLTNIGGMHFNNEIKELFGNFIKYNKPFVKAGAVVGINGLQMILYNGLMKITGRDIKSFSSIEEAKSWLVGQN